MAGLLDFINTPQGMGLLSAVAGGLAGARRGTPINNIGRGLVTGVAGYQGAQDQIRRDKENALTQQYKQMQMDEIQSKITNNAALKTASTQSMQQAMTPGSYGPLGYRPTDPSAFTDANQLAQGNAPEDIEFNQANVSAIAEGNNALAPPPPSQFDFGKYKSAMGNNLAQAGLPEEALKFDKSTNDGRTSEQKNWEFANSLDPEQRAQFVAGNKTNNTPSSIQEWQTYQGMSPEQQQAYREMKRAIPMQDMGGYVAPAIGGGKLGPAIPKTLSPGDLPSTRGAQSAAVESAKVGVERETAKPAAQNKISAEDAKLSRLTAAITLAKQQSGYTSAGVASQLTGWVGGSPAKNLSATLDTVKANLGFDELQQMRDNSPTGGALGQVAVQEIIYLQSVVANLDQAQSPEQLNKNLDIVMQAKKESNTRIKAAYGATYNKSPASPNNLPQKPVTNPKFPGFSIVK